MALFLHFPSSMVEKPIIASIACALLLFLLGSSSHADLRLADRSALEGREGLLLEDLLERSFPGTGAEVGGRLPHALRFPAQGRITSLFGRRTDPLTGHSAFHRGIDIAGAEGANVVSASDGVIIAAGWDEGCGLRAIIDHGFGISTRYCHLRSLTVQRGDLVLAGETIGSIGSTGRSTGPHVHFELRRDRMPEDPAAFLFF